MWWLPLAVALLGGTVVLFALLRCARLGAELAREVEAFASLATPLRELAGDFRSVRDRLRSTTRR